MAIQALERRLGAPLFLRSQRRVALAPAGAALLPAVRRLLQDADDLPRQAQAAAAGWSGRLRLAFVSSIAYGPLPAWLRSFRAAQPEVALELREATLDVQLDAFAAGEIDAGFVLHAEGAAPPGLAAWRALREPLVLALPETHPLAAQRSLRFERIAAEPLVIFPRAIAPSLFDAVVGHYRAQGVTPQIAQEAIQMQTIVNLVSAGIGLAWVPAALMQLQRPGRGLPAAGRHAAALRDQPRLARAGAAGGAALRRTRGGSGAATIAGFQIFDAFAQGGPLMLVHPQFDPVALSLGPVQIHWYGLTYLVAFGLFLFLAARRARLPWFADAGWTRKDVEDLLFFGVVGVVLGGRIGYALFYKPEQYLANPLEILQVWKGGMSFHGGLLGVAVALVVFARLRGRPMLQVMDLVAPCVPTGLASGRIGNFINGELWGRAADPSLPWAMVFPQSGQAFARHPSQLYQFALEGLLLFVLLWLYGRKPRAPGRVAARLRVRLRRVPLRRRVLPRARQLPRPAGAGHEHGPVAVRADDRRRRAAGGGGPVAAPPRCSQERVMAMRQIFLDTETTGLSADSGDRIIEIGCIEMVNRRLTGNNLHFYLNPERSSHPDAVRVHGLTDEFLADKPLFASIADELLDYLQDAEIVIHNAAFDVGFLNAELARLGRGKIAEHVAEITDSLLMAREMFPGKANSLDALCKRLEVDNSNRALHGALLDAGPAGRGLHPPDARPGQRWSSMPVMKGGSRCRWRRSTCRPIDTAGAGRECGRSRGTRGDAGRTRQGQRRQDHLAPRQWHNLGFRDAHGASRPDPGRLAQR